MAKVIDWERVYWEQMPRIYNFFRYRVYDDLLAEDLTATTFERAWRFRENYRHDVAAFSTWLFSIARNVANNHLRKRKPEVPLDDYPIASNQEPLEAMMQRQDDLAQLARIIEGLSDRERELISLKYGAELSHREIADQMGLSTSNVAVIMHRAVQSIRAQWEASR